MCLHLSSNLESVARGKWQLRAIIKLLDWHSFNVEWLCWNIAESSRTTVAMGRPRGGFPVQWRLANASRCDLHINREQLKAIGDGIMKILLLVTLVSVYSHSLWFSEHVQSKGSFRLTAGHLSSGIASYCIILLPLAFFWNEKYFEKIALIHCFAREI